MPGLFAAGEATSSGLHGANRLASNSLLEGLVYGQRAGAAASAAAAKMPDSLSALPISHAAIPTHEEPTLDLADIRNSLKSLMWRAAGVRRNRMGLEDAVESIESWCQYVLTRQFHSAEGWELQNLLTISHLMIDAALQREESRDVHLRSDFPEIDEANWKRHIAFTRQPVAV